jgi:hypothetical protein
VWQNGVAAIRADLREWLRRASEDDSGYVPRHFELSFGLAHHFENRQADPRSVADTVELDCGIKLRGSIDHRPRRSCAGRSCAGISPPISSLLSLEQHTGDCTRE